MKTNALALVLLCAIGTVMAQRPPAPGAALTAPDRVALLRLPKTDEE